MQLQQEGRQRRYPLELSWKPAPCFLHSFILQLFWQHRRFLRCFQNISLLPGREEWRQRGGMRDRNGRTGKVRVVDSRAQRCIHGYSLNLQYRRGPQQECLGQAGIYHIPFPCFLLKLSGKQGGKLAGMCWVEPSELLHVGGRGKG